MTRSPKEAGAQPTEVERLRIEELEDHGLFLKAWEAAQAYGPLRAWTDAANRLAASSLAWNLGAGRLSQALVACAYRSRPDDLLTRSEYAHYLLERRGALSAWEFLQEHSEAGKGNPEAQARWMTVHADVHALFRDFDTAQEWVDRAEAVAGECRSVMAHRVFLFDCQSRHAEALEACRKLLARFPTYRYAIQETAHLLTLLDRDAEAETLLTESAQRLEIASLWAHLYALQMELGRTGLAATSLDRYEALTPLREKSLDQWLDYARCDVACSEGRIEDAVRHIQSVDVPASRKILENLRRAGPHARRFALDVPFVAQHHKTCAPATLTSISRYWSVQAEHLDVVEQICYDGTTAWEERNWAERNGFVTREFTVTWDSAKALIDRGVPFTLTTTQPGVSHLQAVMGYDERRGTLLIRDPSSRYAREEVAEELLIRHRSTGPRGLALVPAEKSGRLKDLALPDAPLYERVQEMTGALLRHDRDTAAEGCRWLTANAPAHYLTGMARLMMADYDRNPDEQLAAVDAMLETFPNDEMTLWRRAVRLDTRTQREQRLALLKRRFDEKDVHPLFLVDAAFVLAEDARENERAMRLLRRALRRGALFESIPYVMANILWNRREFPRAVDLYRFAVCLNDKNENSSTSYFIASRHLKQSERTLAFLEGRFRRFGGKSGQPARTFFLACEQLEQQARGFAVLEEGLALRPADGELLVFAADAFARNGKMERAQTLLKQAEGRARKTDLLRTSATMAEYRGETGRALELWRQILGAESRAVDAHAAVARLLAVVHGTTASRAYLRETAAATPFDYVLSRMLTESLRDTPEEHVAACRTLVDLAPQDSWARRELALGLVRLRRFDEAREHAEYACRREENEAFNFAVLGHVQAAAGRVVEARETFRRAIRLSVDADWAISELMRTCTTAAERRDAVEFVRRELVAQVIFGDGLLAWRTWGLGVIDAPSLLAELREALAARPDLWHAWSAVVQQLTDVGQTEEALALSREATERFPLLPRLWLDRANACRVMLDGPEEIEALTRAFEINPHWSPAACGLADALQRAGQGDRARELLARATSLNPLDAALHGNLADCLWKLGRREEALDHAEKALRITPVYAWAWERFREWSVELRCPGKPLALARDLVRTRPGNGHCWLSLARILPDADFDERLAACDRAVELDPRNEEAYDLRAEILAARGRVDEALAACRPALYNEAFPARLRSRRAWILFDAKRRDEALEEWRTLARDEPENYDARRQLTDGCSRCDRREEYLESARKLVALQPTNPVAFGYLGDALERNGKKDEALVALRRALALDPGYSFGGLAAFDLLFSRNALDEARRVLDTLEQHAPGPYALARRAQVEARLLNHDGAARALGGICRTATEGFNWAFTTAADAMSTRALRPTFERVLSEALADPGCNPDAGTAWMEHVAKSKGMTAAGRLTGRLLKFGEPGARAAARFLILLGERKLRFRTLLFITAHREALRKDTRTWGSAGYALACARHHRRVARWMSDYRDRKDAVPWMLYNLQMSLRILGRPAEAYAATRTALDLAGDHTTPTHRVWSAFYEAITGRRKDAERRMDGVNATSLDPSDAFTFYLTRSVLALQGSPPSPEEIRESDALFNKAVFALPHYRGRRYDRGAYHLAVRRLAQLRGGFSGFLWRMWRTLGTGA